LCEAYAAIHLHCARNDLQQRRLARTVAPDEADALALADRKRGAFQQRRAAEGKVDVLQREDRRGHARFVFFPLRSAKRGDTGSKEESYSSSPTRLDTSASSASTASFACTPVAETVIELPIPAPSIINP